MKNHIILLNIFLFISFSSFSQTNYKEFTPMELVKALEATNFTPITDGVTQQKFKAFLLQIPESTLKQLNINVWYLRSNRYNECYELYKMYYSPTVTKQIYDLYSKELIAFMNLDGVVKSPK